MHSGCVSPSKPWKCCCKQWISISHLKIHIRKMKKIREAFTQFFPLTSSRFLFNITQYGFVYDAFGYHSSRVREKRKIVDSISCAVWWELKTHWECCLCESRIIGIRPYSGLFTLAHHRKMLMLYSWGRTISIDCLQMLLMAQDSDSVQRQIGIRTVHIELCSSISVYRMYRFVAHSTLNILNIEHWTSAVLFCQLKMN